MNGDLLLKSARMVLSGEVVDGTIAVAAGKIVAIDHGNTAAVAAGDIDGDLLLPGLVELHTDNFERHLMPRPKVRWPEMPALLGHDAEVAAAGITTVFDALGVGDTDPEAMRSQDMAPVLDALRHAEECAALRAEHRLHVRCELPAANMLELFAPFRGHKRVGLLSLMDHTPGQRQWENIDHARVYYCGKKGWSSEKFERQIRLAVELQDRYVNPHRQSIAEYARTQRIPFASHDDTTPAHVDQAHGEGASISEFPTRTDAASRAKERGLSVIMGAPNVMRGGSHSGNVSALDLARQGLLDILSSDYVPSSLLSAAFRLCSEAEYPLHRAITTVTLNPATSVGLGDRGEIAIGKRADLVQVRPVRDADGRVHPVVRAVWRSGVRVI
jgi:alpha-D-ribose 1-methylphosphonate 5-triphosphate diphosphatase